MEKELVEVTTWEQLAEATSDTHTLDIDIASGCGWINPKDKNDNFIYYLSTITFTNVSSAKDATMVLQKCGFDVIIKAHRSSWS